MSNAADDRNHFITLLRAGTLTAALLLLAACQSPPSQPQVDAAASAPQAVEPQPEPVVVAPEPEPPVILQCPEPEPVAIPACPPPPKQKPCPKCPESRLDGKILLGEVELVTLDPPGVSYKARIDTGATGTSVHATNIVRFERDGQNWVRFDMDNPDGEPITVEREVVRRVRVRQVDLDEYSRRLVVSMAMTIGSISQQVEFSLNDRSDMEYPVLIGRNFLRNTAIVDVGQELIAK